MLIYISYFNFSQTALADRKDFMQVQEKSPKLLDQCVNKLRVMRKGLSTEKSYIGWIRRFIHFHNLKHPIEMDESHVEEFR